MKRFLKISSILIIAFTINALILSCGDDNDNEDFNFVSSGKRIKHIESGTGWKDFIYYDDGKLKTCTTGGHQWSSTYDINLLYEKQKVIFKDNYGDLVFYLNNKNLADSAVYLTTGDKIVFLYDKNHITKIIYDDENYVLFQWSNNVIESVYAEDFGETINRHYTYTNIKNKSRIYEDQYLGSWGSTWMYVASFIGILGEPTEYLPKKCKYPFEYTLDEDGYVITASSTDGSKTDTKTYYYE